MTQENPSALTTALERFGSPDALTVRQRTTMDMGRYYAAEYDLDQWFDTNPEVCIAAVTLAKARQSQLILTLQIEVDIERRLRESEPGTTYEDVVFEIAKRKAHSNIYEEMSRLEVLAEQYDERLEMLRGRYNQVVVDT